MVHCETLTMGYKMGLIPKQPMKSYRVHSLCSVIIVIMQP